jgi:hypothetical protein
MPTEVVEDVLFSHVCERGFLPFASLSLSWGVSKAWKRAVLQSLSLISRLDFHGHEPRVSGDVVLRALERVAGNSLRFVDLANCRQISASELKEILGSITSCSAVALVDTSGCDEQVVLHGLVVWAQHVLDADTPWDLYDRIQALQEGASRCAFSFLHKRLLEVSEVRQLPRQEFASDFAPGRNALEVAAQYGTAWDVALLTSVSWADGHGGYTRVFDFDDFDEGGYRAPVHWATLRGDEMLLGFLIRAGADLNARARDRAGNTPLLVACTDACHAGKHANALMDAGADISAANREGDTALLAACQSGNFELAERLIELGANVAASRSDGGSLLSLAIASGKERFIKLALEHGPERIARQSNPALDWRADVNRLTRAFFDPDMIEAWIRGGATSLALVGECGALLSCAAVDASVKDQLDNVRAFLHHHADLLQDHAGWPVPHCVQQLAAQEPDSTFAASTNSGAQALVYYVDKPQTRRQFRWSIQGPNRTMSLAFSPNGLTLARAEQNEVVVCCAVSGLKSCTLSGHRYDPFPCIECLLL